MTQNINDLHERAGSERITHMHGELLKARCGACEAVHLWRDDLTDEQRLGPASETVPAWVEDLLRG